MGESKEDIEAKLSAYIDGELDPQGRAEIEEHLRQNPQHRRLIEELMGQTQLLKDLPREKAPPEVLEAMQGQLERSVLLSGINEPVRQSLANRLPQLMALAAIVALAVGLGLVIYIALPADPKELVIDHNTPASTETTPRATVAAAPPAATTERARNAGPAAAENPDHLATADASATAPGVRPERTNAVPPAVAITAEAMRLPGAAARTTISQAGGYATVTINVDDLSAAESRVTRVLLDRKLTYLHVTADISEMPVAPDATAPEESARLMPRAQSTNDSQQRSILVQGVNKSELFDLATAMDDRDAQVQTGRVAEQQVEPIVRQQISQRGLRVDPRQTQSFGGASATTQPAVDEIIHIGDVLGVDVAELKGTSYAPPAETTVRQDGTILLPMVGPVQVDGLTATALKDVISMEYESSGVLPSATIRVTRGGIEIGKDSAGYFESDAAVPTSMPVVDPNALDVLVVLNQREVGQIPVVPADEAKSWDDILAKPLQDTEDSADSPSEEPVPATSQPAVDFPTSQPVIPATQPALDDILP